MPAREKLYSPIWASSREAADATRSGIDTITRSAERISIGIERGTPLLSVLRLTTPTVA